MIAENGQKSPKSHAQGNPAKQKQVLNQNAKGDFVVLQLLSAEQMRSFVRTIDLSEPNFIKLLSRKYCLADSFPIKQKKKLSGAPVCNIANFMEFWLVTSFC